eukprot:262199_1
MCITIQVESMRYLKSSDEYDIKFGDASIISLDITKKQIRCKIKSNKIKQVQEELDDDEFSSILDDIDYDLDAKPDVNVAPNDQSIEREWNDIAPKRSADKKDKAYGSCCIGDCHAIERIAFILKYFSIFMKFKALEHVQGNDNSDASYSSMSAFISSKLRGYNRTRLLSDYYHVKKYHMNSADTEKELLDYMASKVSISCDVEMCSCLTRNRGPKQIYRRLSSKERRELYYICDQIKDGSPEEMNEIALIGYLDIIHSLFIHANAPAGGVLSDGKKFITQIEADLNGDEIDYDDSQSCVTQSDISSIPGAASVSNVTTHRLNVGIPLLKSSFGQSFDYWKSSHPFYCPATYSDLRSELLGNNIHSMSSDDYALLQVKANDYMRCDIGKHLQCKREFRWMKKSIKYGDKMTLHHMICIIISTNYGSMMSDFRNVACRKMDNNESTDDIKRRHCEIANFLRLLKESIWCFGDVLSEKQRVYHAINRRLAFPRCSISFDAPCSVSTKYLVAQKLMHDADNIIVFKLGKVIPNEHSMAYLDVSNFSYYPAEKERLIFGGTIGFVDMIYSGSSHSESVLSLTLYQQMISGKWFNDKEHIYYKKKYQRKVVKMMNNMINYDETHRVHNKFMQQLFESITREFEHKENEDAACVWINKKECDEGLISDLNKLLFNRYISYLIQNGVRVKYGSNIEMKLSVPHINDSSFKKSLYSNKYGFTANHEGDKCLLHFRCYKKYDSHKEEDMFRGFIATQHKLPKKVSKIELKYGLLFDELHYKKWDQC